MSSSQENTSLRIIVNGQRQIHSLLMLPVQYIRISILASKCRERFTFCSFKKLFEHVKTAASRLPMTPPKSPSPTPYYS